MKIWIAAAAIVMLATRAASACGFWRMDDLDKKVQVGWLINAGTVTRGETRLANLYVDLDAPKVRIAADHKVVFDVVRGKVLRYGKAVGTVDGDRVKIADVAFTFEWSNPRRDEDIVDSWQLVVRRDSDGKAIISSERASALCAALHRKDRKMTDAEQQDEVRRRVTFYLAWRALGM